MKRVFRADPSQPGLTWAQPALGCVLSIGFSIWARSGFKVWAHLIDLRLILVV